MKHLFKFLLIALVGISFIAFSPCVKAQTASPRTGNLPQKQVISLADFNQAPPEIQTIIKNNPNLYSIEVPVEIIDTETFEKLPSERQKYILEHPEKFEIRKKQPASTREERL